jgi:hypothetical protein
VQARLAWEQLAQARVLATRLQLALLPARVLVWPVPQLQPHLVTEQQQGLPRESQPVQALRQLQRAALLLA